MNRTSKIKAVLKERGVRQYSLAEKMSITPQSLSKTLRNETVGDRYLKRIVEAINALTPHLTQLTTDDLQTNEATIRCPKCGEKFTVKIER